MKYYAFVGQ